MRKHIGGDASGAALEKVRVAVVLREQRLDLSPIVGEARHAGGTPYDRRRDALLGAAEIALAVERVCRAEHHIVGTVGELQIHPSAINVVPGDAHLSLDLRGEFDGDRDRVWRVIQDEVAQVTARRGLTWSAREVHEASAVFCDPHDPRIIGTIEAIRRDLMQDGLVRRYLTRPAVDGLPPGEGAFIACTFWLADCLTMLGQLDEARAIFERLLDLRNDVGLLAEEYDPAARRQLGNFPQAFSHVALVNTAMNLGEREKPAEQRAEKKAA